MITTENVRKEVVDGSTSVHAAGETFALIQASAHHTALQLEEVSHAIRRLADGSEQIVLSIRANLEVADQTSAGAQSVSAASEEQLATMQEITASAHYLAKMSEELQQQIEKFKL